MDIFSSVGGAPRRIYCLSDNLARYGFKVTVICRLDRRVRRARTGKTTNNAEIIGIPFSQLPLLPLVLLKYSVRADIIQFEFPLYAPLMLFLKILRKPIVLDEHGVEVHFIKEVSKALEKRFSKVDYVKTFLSELLAVKLSSIVFTCSDQDAKMVKEKYNISSNKIVVVPNGVGDDFFEHTDSFRYGKPTIIFMGSFDHAPNIYATKVILNKIVPHVCRRDNNLIFAFVGGNPPRWLVENKTENCVEVFGNVKDVRPYLKGADIAIAPIYHGSGTRIKILEYMALGKPVISTSKGVEGLNMENGKHILVRDDPHEFAETIIGLLSNKNLAVRMRKNGKKLVKEKYRWKDIVKLAIKAYNQLPPHK